MTVQTAWRWFRDLLIPRCPRCKIKPTRVSSARAVCPGCGVEWEKVRVYP